MKVKSQESTTQTDAEKAIDGAADVLAGWLDQQVNIHSLYLQMGSTLTVLF